MKKIVRQEINEGTGPQQHQNITEKRRTAGNKYNIIKTERKTKREDVCIWTTPEMLHNQRRRILADHLPGIFFHQPHRHCT